MYFVHLCRNVYVVLFIIMLNDRVGFHFNIIYDSPIYNVIFSVKFIWKGIVTTHELDSERYLYCRLFVKPPSIIILSPNWLSHQNNCQWINAIFANLGSSAYLSKKNVWIAKHHISLIVWRCNYETGIFFFGKSDRYKITLFIIFRLLTAHAIIMFSKSVN